MSFVTGPEWTEYLGEKGCVEEEHYLDLWTKS